MTRLSIPISNPMIFCFHFNSKWTNWCCSLKSPLQSFITRQLQQCILHNDTYVILQWNKRISDPSIPFPWIFFSWKVKPKLVCQIRLVFSQGIRLYQRWLSLIDETRHNHLLTLNSSMFLTLFLAVDLLSHCKTRSHRYLYWGVEIIKYGK